MNGIELYILGRRLMKLGESAMPTAGFRRLPTTVQLVMVDIGDHPDTSISGIVTRTGLPQSAVSEAVARLVKAGVVATRTNPADRRATLARVKAEVRARKNRAPAEIIDGPLADALGLDDPADVADVVQMLAELARQLDARANATSNTSSAAPPRDGEEK